MNLIENKGDEMFIRAYLRASTQEQDATRAKKQLQEFAIERKLKIAAFYVENESGANLQRPELFKLIEDASEGDVLLVEHVDRLSRLNEADWMKLKDALNKKAIKVVALDLPTSWTMLGDVNMPGTLDEFTKAMFSALNGMMLDMLAAVARKDYITRRERAAQGIAKAKAEGKYKGRPENKDRNDTILTLLKAGESWADIMRKMDCSRATVAKQASLLRLGSA